MTLPAGINSEGSGDRPGTGLSPVAENAGVDTFLAAMGEPEAPRPRPWRMRLFNYSAHAAMIVGLIGFAWTVSDHVVHRPAAPSTGAVTTENAAAAPARLAAVAPAPVKPEYASPDAAVRPDQASIEQPKAGQARSSQAQSDPTGALQAHADAKIAPIDPDEVAELRRTNARLSEDVKALRADVASLSRTVKADQAREQQVRALSASVDGVSSGLSAAKTETSAALAKLSGRIDTIQREARVPSVDAGTTGSLAPKQAAESRSAPLPPAKPAAARLASLEEERRPSQDAPAQKPAALAGWAVLDVYEGVALVEGKRGAIEVMPGATIPGAGVVRSIDRSGNGWTVTTTKGVIAFGAPGRYARSREPLRPYRYDF